MNSMIPKSTQPILEKQIKRAWHIIDLQDQNLGREATKIANLLMGKNKQYFVRNMDCGDYVIIINAKEVAVTGKKEVKKVYTRYSGYPGGLRKETLGELRNRRPEQIVRHAVSGMLPKNRLRERMLTRLYVFADANHPYSDKIAKEESKE
jgi:large subunit ribosomal protein L13